jgi:ribosome biogenesis GTPase
MKAVVIKSTGSWYELKNNQSEIIICRIRGKFRIKGIKTTNPVAVGDYVEYEMEKNKDTGIITQIYLRKNYLLRRSINLSKQYHILAANIDQVFITAPIINPETTTVFIDRILVTAKAYNIPAILLINKIDLIENSSELELKKDKLVETYQKIGYTVLEVSAETKYQIGELKNLMKNKTSMFTGHSGAGKSSLINAVDSNLQLKTGEISETHLQGKHITTFAQMFELQFGGSIIDTPGIRGFGVVDMKPEEIDSYFPDIFKYKQSCKFNNCLHVNEPNCAVKTALINNEISKSRYKSYLQLLEEANENGDNPYRTKKVF